MSMITATAWVPRGFAARYPTKYDVDENELARISKLAQISLEDAKDELEKAKAGEDGEVEREDDPEAEGNSVEIKDSNEDIDDDLREYDLENYDESVDEDGEPMAMFGNAKSLAYHESNDDDPYITLKDGDDFDEEEREELQVLGSDNMLLAAKVEDEVAHIEIYVYEDEADNLYVHHDIMLPAIPLCLEWLDIPVGQTSIDQPVDQTSKGNFLAVGTFDPDIEIWDLDTIDSMYPNAILGKGGEESKTDPHSGQKKKKRKKSKKVNDEYHVDAVLALAANRNHRSLLASGSADNTVKLWDLNSIKCARSYSFFNSKCCSLDWHKTMTTVLLSGSYDQTIVAGDMRAPDAQVPRWAVESDVESVRWNPHDSNYFFVTTEAGVIHYHDSRVVPSRPEGSSPVWKLQAHDQAVSSFGVNPIIPGFFVTGSFDKDVKLWQNLSSGPSMVVSRDLGVGKVFSTTFAPDAEVGFRLAVAGSKGAVQIWDTSTNAAVRRAFADRVAPAKGEVKERLVGIDEDSSSSEDDEGSGSEIEGGEEGQNAESMDED